MSAPEAVPPERRAPERRRPRSFRAVALGGGFLGALIVAVSFALYVRFVRYERIAAHHVPEGSVLAARIDVQQAMLYDPVRRHVLPLLGGPSREPKDGDAALARFEAVSGLDRGDLREIVAARGARREDWVLVFTGLFARSVTVGQLWVALGANDPAWKLSDGGAAVFRSDSGIAVGRAADGAFLLASSLGELERARPSASAGVALGLEPRGPGSFALGPAAVQELVRFPAVLARPELAAALGSVTGVAGSLSLGDQVGLRVVFNGAGAPAARALVDGIREMLGTFGKMADTEGGALARATAERAEPLPSGDGVQFRWEREELDRMFVLLAEAIRRRAAGPE
ncbi:MAG TPA: hypothetical protein VHE30_05690 [Polyangiaceae bacterium]|nr:hypothetical protein [Polyangiaceae bacterium]